MFWFWAVVVASENDLDQGVVNRLPLAGKPAALRTGLPSPPGPLPVSK